MSLVVDASAVAELLVSRDGGTRVARVILDRELFAPQLLVAEVVSTVRGWVLGGRLDPLRARGALDDFRALDVTLMPMMPLVDDMWLLRDNISAYDAMYVALARSLGLPLLTLDARLVTSLPPDVHAVGL